MIKNPPANAGVIRDASLIPGSERSLKEGTATHSNILAWRIPQIEHLVGYNPRVAKSLRRLKQFSMQAYTGMKCSLCVLSNSLYQMCLLQIFSPSLLLIF